MGDDEVGLQAAASRLQGAQPGGVPQDLELRQRAGQLVIVHHPRLELLAGHNRLDAGKPAHKMHTIRSFLVDHIWNSRVTPPAQLHLSPTQPTSH